MREKDNEGGGGFDGTEGKGTRVDGWDCTEGARSSENADKIPEIVDDSE